MITTWHDSIVGWIVDYYVLSSVLLLSGLVVIQWLEQPARRIAVARAVVGSLLASVLLTVIPGWPRLAWRSNRPAEIGRGPITSNGRPPGEPPSASGGDRRAVPRLATMPQGRPPVEFAGTSSHREGARAPAVQPAPLRSRWARDGSWTEILTALFVGGPILAVTWLVLGAIMASRLVRRSRIAPESLCRLLERGIIDPPARARLRLCPTIGQPVALGLFRPSILLPEAFAASEPDGRIRMALAHELAHIRNGDLVLLAGLRTLLPILYLHPLYWWLRQRIRLDQEILADASALMCADRTAYAESLLEWSRSVMPARLSASSAMLALWERPSQLYKRVAALLDPCWNVELDCPRRWRVTAWAISILVSPLLSSMTLRPVAGRDEPRAGLLEQLAQPADAVVFGGQVVDPDGRPFVGAKLYLSEFRSADRNSSFPLRARSDTAGRFRFKVEKAHFELPHLEPWRNARVIALADGFGPGGTDSDLPDAGRELTVRLARDDVPITGRLMDLEGRAVAGAVVQAERFLASTSGDLTPWYRAAVANGDATCYDLEAKYLRFEVPLNATFLFPTKVTTNADGRFELRGIGRERIVDLRVEGPTIRTMEAAVVTRPGLPVQVPILHRRREPLSMTFYPATLVLSAAPSRGIEGVVRDRDGGEPIAGATIRSYRLADIDSVNNALIRTTADAQGRFRMTGMPLGTGNEVVILPPEGQPFLPSWQRLPALSVAEPLRVDLKLKRGILAQGRLTDAVSGRPVKGEVRYGAAGDNPHLALAPGLGDVPTNGDMTTATSTDDDGRYRIAVLPGRGLLLVVAADGDYRKLDPDVAAMPDPLTLVPPIYNTGHAFAEIDVAPNSPPLTRDFSLERCRQLPGVVVGPDGKPLVGARVYGKSATIGFWPDQPEEFADFTIAGLQPPEERTLVRLMKVRGVESLAAFMTAERPRTLVVQHDGKQLAGFNDVWWETKGPIKVKLEPWAVVTGRLVDSDGRPRAGIAFLPEIIGKFRLGGGHIGHWPDRITTDRDGRFRVEAIVPGLRYRLTLERASGGSTDTGPVVTPLEPGEARDLGDVSAIIPGEPD